MHLVLTITAIHDRYLTMPYTSQQTFDEIYHGSQAVTLFNQKLSQPIKPSDRDPIWATAALIGTITCASIEATTPEEAWPLRPPGPSDLDWLKMCSGKMVIWKIANPSRPDSVFRSTNLEYMTESLSPVAQCGVEGIPVEFIQLCGLN
jgi:hypothetical protein